MFQRILVANRGEIALRVIRACRDLGVEAVAVFSEADRDAAYLQFADEAICIGPPPSADSYLNIRHIIAAAELANVQAVHPGYGFLSENAHFAEVCRTCHIEFIGPPEEAMRKLGNKNEARKLAQAAGVPVVPGSEGLVQNEAQALGLARTIGYQNVGTCEFLVDPDFNFYFIEVNARIQVEHPVTELVTGIDLVREQIRIAAGEPLSFTQEQVVHRGAAIECRINAEDPAADFRPCPGVVTRWQVPGGPGVRLDSHVVNGYKVPPNYDSLMAKLLVYQ